MSIKKSLTDRLPRVLGAIVETVSKTSVGFIGVQHATIIAQRNQLAQMSVMLDDVKRMSGAALKKLSQQLVDARTEGSRLRDQLKTISTSLDDASKQQSEAYTALSFDADPLGETLPEKARRRMREYYEYKSHPLVMSVTGDVQPRAALVQPSQTLSSHHDAYARDAVLRAIQRTWGLATESVDREQGYKHIDMGTHEADQLIELALKSKNGDADTSLVGLVTPHPSQPDSESLITTREPSC